MPKVSICIPTYNMAHYVGLAVESALNQTFTDIEVVVCDNASTDNTRAVLSRFNDPRLKIFRNETNLGAIKNFNKTVECSKGEYIKFLEADDILLPDCVSEMVKVLEQDPCIVMVNCEKNLIDSNGNFIEQRLPRKTEILSGKLLIKNMRETGNIFGTPTDILLRRSVLSETGLFDPSYGTYLNDWDLWIRIAEKGSVAFAPGVLVQVRRHTGQIGAIGALTNKDMHVAMQMIEKRFGSFYPFGYKFRFLLHFSEHFIWRACSLACKNPSGNKIKNIFDVNQIIIGYLRFYYPLFLLFFIIHSPVFVILWADRRHKRSKNIKRCSSSEFVIN